jgi:hypothetical protein
MHEAERTKPGGPNRPSDAGGEYVTHIQVKRGLPFCRPEKNFWMVKATGYKTARSRGFFGFDENECRHFDCATWLHRAQDSTQQELQEVMHGHFTGAYLEPFEMVSVKLPADGGQADGVLGGADGGKTLRKVNRMLERDGLPCFSGADQR